MADSQHKRKFDDRGSGVSYNRVPPSLSDFELAKQRAEQIAARLVQDSAKRSRFDDPHDPSSYGEQRDSPPPERGCGKLLQNFSQAHTGNEPVSGNYYSMRGTPEFRKMEIPNAKVGLVIGKGGETIKYIQQQAGARIQITRDSEHNPCLPFRMVELIGTPEQISRAEQLIHDVIAEADADAAATNTNSGYGGQVMSEQVRMNVPTNKVGLIIGRGGETIKSLQSRTGARIQLVPIQGSQDQSSGVYERELILAGTKEQIDAASVLIKELISETRTKPSPVQGTFNQQTCYPQGPPTMRTPQGGPSQVQQQGYDYPLQNYGYQQYAGQVQPYGGQFQQHINGWSAPPPPPLPPQYSTPVSYGYYDQAQAGGYGVEAYEQTGYEQPPGTSKEFYGQQPDGYEQANPADESYGPPGIGLTYGPPGIENPSSYSSVGGYGHFQPSDQSMYVHDNSNQGSCDQQCEVQTLDQEISNDEDSRVDEQYRGPVDVQDFGNYGYEYYKSSALPYWQPGAADKTGVEHQDPSKGPVKGSDDSQAGCPVAQPAQAGSAQEWCSETQQSHQLGSMLGAYEKVSQSHNHAGYLRSRLDASCKQDESHAYQRDGTITSVQSEYAEHEGPES